MVFTSRNWFVVQGPVAIILISWNVIFIWERGYWTRVNYESKCQKHSWHCCWLPYLYTFSLYENPSFTIVSAETEYMSTISWYWNINFLRDRIRRIFLDLQNFFHWYILQSWKLKRSQIQLRLHHFWTYTSNLTTVVNSVLKFKL
jgi:hypothetical protein